eukprot:COSAG05_NODE_401_length_10253_cov_23.087453_2_plen_89_part_00
MPRARLRAVHGHLSVPGVAARPASADATTAAAGGAAALLREWATVMHPSRSSGKEKADSALAPSRMPLQLLQPLQVDAHNAGTYHILC